MQTHGLLFDFLSTQKTFSTDTDSKAKDTCHIILSQKLFTTLDEQKKPHIRAAVFGYPSILSTSGIVEGPAKPKEYYIYKQKYTQLGIWDREEKKIKQKFKGRFIDYQDKRLTQVLKGYLAQALYFYIMEEPFCKTKSCRLFNAHWQEELIYSQIKWRGFCRAHKKMLKKIKDFT